MKDLQLANIRNLCQLVMDESKRQVELYGIQDRSSIEWGSITTEEHGELIKAINDYWFNEELDSEILAREVIKEAIHSATLHLKIAEMFLNTLNPKE